MLKFFILGICTRARVKCKFSRSMSHTMKYSMDIQGRQKKGPEQHRWPWQEEQEGHLAFRSGLSLIGRSFAATEKGASQRKEARKHFEIYGGFFSPFNSCVVTLRFHGWLGAPRGAPQTYLNDASVAPPRRLTREGVCAASYRCVVSSIGRPDNPRD